jgi:hypothetical protein
LYAWGVGGNSLILPPEAGYLIGAKNDSSVIQYLLLEIHYNHPSASSGRVDSSGVIFHFTEHLRPNHAGSLVLGNIGNDEAPIPANTANYRVQADCPSTCTNLWPHPITVFGDFLHMHQLGSMIWSTQHRDNQTVSGDINRIEYWDFQFQDYTPINRVIEPGDRLNLNCIYDTTLKSNETRFGINSDDEMCLEFMAYYPRFEGLNFLTCGSFRGRYKIVDGNFIPFMNAETRNFSTVCWNHVILDENNVTIANPSVLDLESNRTFGSQSSCIQEYEPVPIFFWILVAILGSLVLCSIFYGFTQLAKSKKEEIYAPVPLEEVNTFEQE